MTDFQYPLPGWAEAHNPQRERCVGAQLQTLDSTRTGNAVIVGIHWDAMLGYLFTCRTDKGNEFRYTLNELNSQYRIGPFILRKSEYTSRKIVLATCRDCPHQGHKGGFGNPAYIPCCTLTKRELPYASYANAPGNGTTASQLEGIPDWCPLEKH